MIDTKIESKLKILRELFLFDMNVAFERSWVCRFFDTLGYGDLSGGSGLGRIGRGNCNCSVLTGDNLSLLPYFLYISTNLGVLFY